MNRINLILNDPFFLECISLNQAREEDRRFCRHDKQHLIDVARICYILILEEQKDGILFPQWGREQTKEVVYAAGLLHDIGRWQQYDTGEDHAVVGARWAHDILSKTGFSDKEIQVITSAISRHRSGSTGGGVLGKYLRRADDLSRPCWRCKARAECKKVARMEPAGGLVY